MTSKINHCGVWLPDWANDEQLDGMRQIITIAKEYGYFDVTFKQSFLYWENESVFKVCLEWENSNAKGLRYHEMIVGFDYEETWDCYGEQVHQWQFIFDGGEVTREMTVEVFFLDLFFYLDSKLNLVAEKKAEGERMMKDNVVTCVYCGHEYPGGTPTAKHELLTEHIKNCEKHPMRGAEQTIAKLRSALVGLIGVESKEELDAMEIMLRRVPTPESDRIAAINAIDALRQSAEN